MVLMDLRGLWRRSKCLPSIHSRSRNLLYFLIKLTFSFCFCFIDIVGRFDEGTLSVAYASINMQQLCSSISICIVRS
jgi:hypothetical protein